MKLTREQKLKIKDISEEDRKMLYYNERVRPKYNMNESIEIKGKIPEENIKHELVKEQMIEKEIKHTKAITGEVIGEEEALEKIKEAPKNIAAVLRELLDKPMSNEASMANNLPDGAPRKYLMAVKLIKLAEEGSLGAIKTVFDRVDGKVPNVNNSSTLKVTASPDEVKNFLEFIKSGK